MDRCAYAENFMTGLKVVFNRERSVLGWEKFDCKKIQTLTQHHQLISAASESNV
jgi:hypothetical protein